ncbi:MAG TPA: PBP1A family penicillin-binding protein [Woeseiaceae bacterium]|nr:PBP1A family penicillin-binding protein [Woeseiaceae bacterium]
MLKADRQGTRSGRTSRRRYARWLVLVAGLGTTAVLGVAAAVLGAWYYVAPGLPAAETIREIPLQIPLRIYSRDGRLIDEIGERRRILVTFDDLPDYVVDAFVAAEDHRFFEHPGVDYRGILRAAVSFLRSGDVSQGGGGSTITQQLARDYFLTRDVLLTRKLREAFLAYKIEQEFSKEEIMSLFVNKMFFGQRAYGVAAAAQVYYGKGLQNLTIAEAATIAGVLPSPSYYNPVTSPSNAGMRRSYVLRSMRDMGFIDDLELEEAMNYPLESRLYGTANELSAPWVAEMARRELLDRYGEDAYSAGYKVVTTLDSKLQKAANYALRNGLLEFDRRRGYRGPITNIATSAGDGTGAPLDVLQKPYAEWPDELKLLLAEYGNPGGLAVGLVTALNEDNSAAVVLQNGRSEKVPWRGISWAKPFITREATGPAPKTVADVLSPGDIVYLMPTTSGSFALAQAPEAQSAVVSVDPMDGAITSLSGGFDFSISKFNRVTQAARQPGSSFKPFIFSAALEQGNTPATIILDAPVVINSSELEAVWRPHNYTGRFYGEQRLREVLVRSMNLASVRLLLNNTGIGNALRHISKFGFGDAALPRNGSLALGGGNASPLDMAQGFAVFANGGHAIKPYVIDSISGPDGEILYRAEPAVVCRECEGDLDDVDDLQAALTPDEFRRRVGRAQGYEDDAAPEMTLEQMAAVGETYRPDATAAPELFRGIKLAPRVISEQNAYLVSDMMRDVITRGTGRRALALGRSDLSGKTGTSNDRRDAWFGGFNADLSAVVWVGYDDDLPLGPGEEGSRTALPVWVEFMRIALKGAPQHALPMPEGIVNVRISKTTGCPASAADSFEDLMFEIFRADHVPQCENTDNQPDIFNTSDDDKEEAEPIF